jgi:hypothetical protein
MQSVVGRNPIGQRPDGFPGGTAHASGMTSRVSPKACSLRVAVGEHELCPGARCAFWDERDGCEIEHLQLPVDQNRELARHLLDLRLAVESSRDETELANAHRRLAELLNLSRE